MLTMVDTTPLLPCRPATLSPIETARFIAIYTLTILITPDGSTYPFSILLIRSSLTPAKIRI